MNEIKSIPPHDEQIEKAVLGCLLTCPACVAETNGLIPRAFYITAHQEISRAILSLKNRSMGVDTITVFNCLKECGKHEDVGGLQYLSQLYGESAVPAQFGDYLKKLNEYFERRQAISDSALIEQSARDLSYPIENLRRDREAMLEAGCNGIAGEERLDGVLESCAFNLQNKPAPIRPIFKLAGITISTPGNLSTVTAPSKVGKTALTTAMMAAPMAVDGADCLGVESSNPEKKCLLHFDTEQSRDDHWYLINGMLRRAGLTECPDWFHSFCLTGKPPREAWTLIQRAITATASLHGGILSIVIDGYADLANNVNDPEESNLLVSQLHDTAIKHDCPIIGILHFNPGTEKSRGHLGSQLERKSETNLILEKIDDVTTVYSTRQRRAPIPKGTGPYFRWDDEARMHVSCESKVSAKETAKTDTARMERDEVFGNRAAMRYSDMKTTLMGVFTKSDTTAERKIANWEKYGLIKKGVANLWEKAT